MFLLGNLGNSLTSRVPLMPVRKLSFVCFAALLSPRSAVKLLERDNFSGSLCDMKLFEKIV